MVRRVLEKLRGVKVERAGQWQACCPAHEDRTPSLSVGVGADGKVLIHCQAGCATEAVLGALGLTPADMFPPDTLLPPRAESSRRREIVETYDYTDADGTLLFEVVRLDPKDFRQRWPDGKGGWEWNLNGARRVLYRLPEVIEAAAMGRTIHVCEGERDADRLAALGLTATTNAGGAEKWRTEYNATLRDAHVVVLPDNDVPGRKHALQVAEALDAVAASVCVLQLPGLPDKGDVSGWLDASGTVDELVRLASQPSVNFTEGSDDEPAYPQARCALTAAPEEPLRYRVRRMILDSEPGLLAAEGGQGKTTAAIAVCGATINGSPIFDNPDFKPEPGPVLFVSEEDSGGVLRNRLEALIEGQGWDRDRVLGGFHYMALEGANLNDVGWQQHIQAEAERLGAVLVVFDPLFDLTEGGESNEDLKPVIRYARRLARGTGAAVWILHHAGKAVEGRKAIDRIRGASALNQHARFIWFLEEVEGGISFQCLKLSRAKKPAPFVVRSEVEVDPENETLWTSARLTYVSAHVAEKQTAERFIMDMLTRYEHGVTSTDLRKLAAGKINNAAVAEAQKNLEAMNIIIFDKGPRGSKLWRLNSARALRQGTLPELPEVAGQCRDPASHDPALYIRQGQAEVRGNLADDGGVADE